MRHGDFLKTKNFPIQEPWRLNIGGPELIEAGRIPTRDVNSRAINMLTLKLVAWDPSRGIVASPQQTDFHWDTDVMYAECDALRPCKNTIEEKCHCGIYTSPGIEALEYYDTHANTVVMLVNLFGITHIYEGDSEQPWTYICRSYGARLIGTVTGNRFCQTSYDEEIAFGAAQKLSSDGGFQMSVYPWRVVRKMIKKSWSNAGVGIDPYLNLDNLVAINDPSIKMFWNGLDW